MNPLALIAGWILVAAGLAQLPGLWAGGRAARVLRGIRPLWPFGDHLLLGYLKALPTIMITALLLFSTVTAGQVLTPIPGFAPFPIRLIELSFAAATGIGALLTLSIMIVGRPRAFVPPQLRSVEDLRELG